MTNAILSCSSINIIHMLATSKSFRYGMVLIEYETDSTIQTMTFCVTGGITDVFISLIHHDGNLRTELGCSRSIPGLPRLGHTEQGEIDTLSRSNLAPAPVGYKYISDDQQAPCSTSEAILSKHNTSRDGRSYNSTIHVPCAPCVGGRSQLLCDSLC